MTETRAVGRRDSIVVTVIAGIGVAVTVLALASKLIPFIGDRMALLISLIGIVLGSLGLVVALARNTRLAIPVAALLIAAVPSATHSLHEKRTVWVESDELCYRPGFSSLSLVGALAGVAAGLDHRNAVGNNVCEQLGKRYMDSNCDGPLGRIKCEP